MSPGRENVQNVVRRKKANRRERHMVEKAHASRLALNLTLLQTPPGRSLVSINREEVTAKDHSLTTLRL